MQKKQRYITAGVTIAAAAAAAHLMQQSSSTGSTNMAAASISVPAPGKGGVPADGSGDGSVTLAAATPDSVELGAASDSADAARVRVELPAKGDPARTEEPAGVVAEFPRPPSDVLMPDPLPNPGAALRDRLAVTRGAASPAANPDTQPARNKFGLACGPILSASAADAGMVSLTLTAPCRGNARIDVRHGPLAFTDKTDELGTYRIKVPALMQSASFTVSFEDGETLDAEVRMPELADSRRVAVVAESDAGLQIHALEFGADYGDPGHVWAEAPRDAQLAALDGGGYLVRLGDASLPDAMVSEIYTFPQPGGGKEGVVRLSVEAEVTAANCARDVTGQTIEPTQAGAPVAMTLTLSMPDCDAVGEFLVLKNLLRDPRIAAN